MCTSNWATHCLDCSRRSMMKDSMGYSSHHHWGCLFTYWLIFVMTCLWTFLGKLNIDTWLLVAWCVIPYWLKSLHLPSVASLLLCVTEWAGMWLYSSPLEALVVVVITGTDRTVISYININSLVTLTRCRDSLTSARMTIWPNLFILWMTSLCR